MDTADTKVREGLPSPWTLAPPRTSEEKEQYLNLAERMIELAIGDMNHVEKGVLNSVMTAMMSKLKAK